MDRIMEFIRPELMVLVVFIYCVGLFLKLYPGFSQEWMIPYVLLGVSFGITLAYVCVYLGEGFRPAVLVAVVIQSVLIAAAAVFANQLWKQAKEKRQNG